MLIKKQTKKITEQTRMLFNIEDTGPKIFNNEKDSLKYFEELIRHIDKECILLVEDSMNSVLPEKSNSSLFKTKCLN
jgi:hypothetical protein